MQVKQRFQPRFSREMLGLNTPVKRLSIIFLIYVTGWAIVNPYFPLYLRQLFGSYTSVGLIVSLLEFFALAWALLLGPALDLVNKKTVISSILAIYLPLSPILLSMRTIAQFVWFRVYHSFIATSLWLTSEAYLRGHTPKGKEAQAIGLFDFCQGLALVIGGLLGAALVVFIGFDILYAISFFALLAFLVSLRLPDHTQGGVMAGLKTLTPAKVKEEIAHYLKDRRLCSLTIYAFPFFFTAAFLAMALPLFLESIGASLPVIGLISALFYLPLLFESYFSTRDRKRTVLLGLVSSAVLFLAMFSAKDPVTVFFLVIMLGIAMAAVHPILSGSFTPLMPKDKVGEYSAVLFATKSVAAGLGPLVAGLMADAFGLDYVFLLGFVIFVLLIAFRERCMEQAF